MIEVYEAVGIGNGQRLLAGMTNHLLPISPILDGVRSAAGKSRGKKTNWNEAVHPF